VVIGRGLTIGRPLALLLAMKRPGCNAAVTVVHTGVDDFAGLVRQGDVVVAAAGRAGLVTADMIKPGRRSLGRGRAGRAASCSLMWTRAWRRSQAGSPAPRRRRAMTRAMLLRNAVRAAERVR